MLPANGQLCIGIIGLPESIRCSKLLTKKAITLLAEVPEVPSIDPAWHNERVKNIFQYYSVDPAEMEKELQLYAAELLQQNNVQDAWQVLLSIG